MKPVVEAKDVSKWYGDVIALNSCTLKIDPGITGIVGTNGAGKSTFFKLLLGLIKPNKGYVLVKGQRPWNNYRLMEHIGYLPDHEFLPESETGFEYLRYVAGLRGIDRWPMKERIDEIAHAMGIVPHLNRTIEGYSKGMKQRLKIAGALIHEPSLLILDEPFAGMDPQVKKSIIEILEELSKEGKDIVISSHVLHDIERITKKVSLMYRGRSIASGNIYEIRSLLDQFPHTVTIRCNNPRQMAKELVEYPWVTSVDFDAKHKERLTVKVKDLEKFHHMFSRIVLEKDYRIKEMYTTDEGLESVFKYLMSD